MLFADSCGHAGEDRRPSGRSGAGAHPGLSGRDLGRGRVTRVDEDSRLFAAGSESSAIVRASGRKVVSAGQADVHLLPREARYATLTTTGFTRRTILAAGLRLPLLAALIEADMLRAEAGDLPRLGPPEPFDFEIGERDGSPARGGALCRSSAALQRPSRGHRLRRRARRSRIAMRRRLWPRGNGLLPGQAVPSPPLCQGPGAHLSGEERLGARGPL